MYRERLHAAALKVLKASGNRLHLETSSGGGDQASPQIKEVEFFTDENFRNGNHTKLGESYQNASQPLSIAERMKPLDPDSEVTCSL